MFRFPSSLRARLSRLGPKPFSFAVAAIFASIAGAPVVTDAFAKGPGQTYCFLGTCHRVKTIAETQSLVGRDLTLVASFYDSCAKDRYNPCGLTSSGERFRPESADNAASPMFPDGTVLLVWSPINKESVVLRINNAGPYWGNRTLDLSRAAARKLGIGGVGKVKARVIKAPAKRDATYSANRRYDAVPGSSPASMRHKPHSTQSLETTHRRAAPFNWHLRKHRMCSRPPPDWRQPCGPSKRCMPQRLRILRRQSLNGS
jgi:rare lipoprotein A (peptidoglycan hydrolase)